MRSEGSHDSAHVLQGRAARAFAQAYGTEPTHWTAAPGRVNLIGEHTDYNDGYVLPVAIDRHIVVAAKRRTDRLVRLHAVDLDDSVEFSLDDIGSDPSHAWSNYERGVAWALEEAGYELPGMDAVLTGDVPIGAGLSSSAAVEVATAFTFQALGGLALDGVQRALVCQRAENAFVGMRCGIMDQYIVSLGRRDHALLIDCRSLEYRLVPVPTGCSIVVCDTKKQRGLVDSEYNTRRQECERGAALLGVPALRDVSVSQLQARLHELGETTGKRCRHVVTENERTLQAVSALEGGEIAQFGVLMNASHVSLRDDYEVSCRELDAMVEAAWQQEGVHGARMTGGGFGGCTVNLVNTDHAQAFQRAVSQTYTAATGIVPEIYLCAAEAGVRSLP